MAKRANAIGYFAEQSADNPEQWSQLQPAGVCSWRPAGINTVHLDYIWSPKVSMM